MTDTANAILVPEAELSAYARALLESAGASGDHARVVVDHLIEAERMGLKSHGIMRMAQYLADIESGEIDPVANPRFERTAPGRSVCDGAQSFGQVVGTAMADEAVDLARSAGIAFVAGLHMGHTGRIGAYAERIAAAGMLGVAVCSGPPSGHWVAPFGGREGRMATNPIAFAYPARGRKPMAADFSTSVIPEGAVRSLKNRGLKAPRGAIRDATGAFSEDPAALYGPPRGALQPIGGDVGYRGTALAMLVEILATLFSGDRIDDRGRRGSDLAMLAIEADDGFAARAAEFDAYLVSSPPIESARPVMLPGERERLEEGRTAGRPLPVDGPTWAAMGKAARGRGIAIPSPAG